MKMNEVSSQAPFLEVRLSLAEKHGWITPKRTAGGHTNKVAKTHI